jgi:stress response protein SCP2
VDVSAVLLTAARKVRGDGDLVFYNHPAQDGVTVDADSVGIDFARMPGDVQTVAVVASVDAARPGAVFDAASTPRVEISCGGRQLAFTPPPLHLGETVVVLAEFYRRGDGWKARAVGQGYATGLAGLAEDFGVVVDDPGPAAPPQPVQQPVQPPVQPPPPARPFTAQPPMAAPVQPPPPARPFTPPPPVAAPVTPPPPPPPPAPPVAAPAISLEKVQRSAPALVDLYKQAGISLTKQGLAGQRAAVYLVLDHSSSMKGHYKNGTMQHLAEQVLGLSANLDDDGIVPLVFFANGVQLISDISLDNYSHRVQALQKKARWGGTAYAPAMQAVIQHYGASGATDPAFVVFQTDGEPFDRRQTVDLLRQTSALPIFWQFVGFGHSRNLSFLQSLDTLTGRVIDNAGFFPAGEDPRARPDAALYDALMSEFPSWLRLARQAGIVR